MSMACLRSSVFLNYFWALISITLTFSEVRTPLWLWQCWKETRVLVLSSNLILRNILSTLLASTQYLQVEEHKMYFWPKYMTLCFMRVWEKKLTECFRTVFEYLILRGKNKKVVMDYFSQDLKIIKIVVLFIYKNFLSNRFCLDLLSFSEMLCTQRHCPKWNSLRKPAEEFKLGNMVKITNESKWFLNLTNVRILALEQILCSGYLRASGRWKS